MEQPSTARQLRRGLWAETLFRYRQKLPLIILLTIIFISLQVFGMLSGHPTDKTLGTIPWILLPISVHASMLNGTGWAFPSVTRVIAAFLWRAMVLSLAGLVIASLALLVAKGSSPYVMTALFILYILVTVVLLSVAGTWLPAVVADGGDRSLGTALRRGRIVFAYTFKRLLAGVGATCLINIAAAYFTTRIGRETGLGDMRIGSISPIAIAITTVLTFSIALTFVMMAVILSRAYLLAEAKDQPFR